MSIGSIILLFVILYALYAIFEILKCALILVVATSGGLIVAACTIVSKIYRLIKGLIVKEHPSMEETIRRAKEWRRSQGYDW